MRLTALEDRVEAEVELGHHDEVIASAASLHSLHPDRERACRLAMLALHRAGRQQDALDVYEATRQALDEQWGLEPSPETRALQMMILTQDPAIAPARPMRPAVGTVRRPVSLLLVEPLLDDDLALEAAGAALEDVRRTAHDVAARHGGVVSPESGVELVVAFGVNGAHEDDVVRAARAAVELREILRGRAVAARYAVGTGRVLVEDARPVLVGAVLGRTRRALHDAEGDEIRLTAVAARLGGDAFDPDVDGRLLGVRSTRPVLASALAPLVGRADELAALYAAYDGVVSEGRPRHVAVVGEAGMGKSRLVEVFTNDVPAVVLRSTCVSYGEGISFRPLLDLADRAEEVDDGAPPLGELSSADAAFAAARALVEHFTRSGPVVVVLDDMHWAVPTFLDLVEYVVRTVDGPLLVVSMARPELLEQRPSWRDGAIGLRPLSAEDAKRLVDALPERDAVEEALAATILDAAEGVPLFLEQLAAHAVQSGLSDDDRVPSTLDALLASRIDALEPGERDVLSRAAVAGREFALVELRAMTPEPELRELDGRLASLARHRLVRPRAGEHEFVHPLVRRATYLAIARPDRADLHERLARWLVGEGAADEVVGVHLERAASDSAAGSDRDALSREASERLGGAGFRALMAADHAAAANLLGRAAALLEETDPDRMELECRLSQALRGLGVSDERVALLQGVVERAQRAREPRFEVRARVELMFSEFERGTLTTDDATAFLEIALGVFRDAEDVLGVARAELAFVTVLGDSRADAALMHTERMREAYASLGFPGEGASHVVFCAIAGATHLADIGRLCEDELARRADSPRIQAYMRMQLARVQALSGDLADARANATRASVELEALGEEIGRGAAVGAQAAAVEALAGDWEQAERLLRFALASVREHPTQRVWEAYFLARLGETALERGDVPAAAALVEEARAAVVGDTETEILWRRVAARAYVITGRHRAALRLGREAVRLADGTDDLLTQAGARLDFAEVLVHADREAEASVLVEEALARFDRKGATLPAANALGRFKALLAQGGRGAAIAAPPKRRP